MRVVMSPPGIHHNPKYFPDPEKFDPSRFSKKNLATRSSYVHLGFGAGPRNCIGTVYHFYNINNIISKNQKI